MLLGGIRWNPLSALRLGPVGRVGLGGREFSCEKFDDSAVLFLLKCGVEHLPVFRQVVGFVLGPTVLVAASDF